MNRKALTPVVAIVLLISVTLASVGALTQYIDIIDEITADTDAEQITSSLDLNFESCWQESDGEYHAQLRHEDPRDAMSTENLLILIEGREPVVNFNRDLVDPGETFRIEVEEGNELNELESPFAIEIISGDNRETIICS